MDIQTRNTSTSFIHTLLVKQKNELNSFEISENILKIKSRNNNSVNSLAFIKDKFKFHLNCNYDEKNSNIFLKEKNKCLEKMYLNDYIPNEEEKEEKESSKDNSIKISSEKGSHNKKKKSKKHKSKTTKTKTKTKTKELSVTPRFGKGK